VPPSAGGRALDETLPASSSPPPAVARLHLAVRHPLHLILPPMAPPPNPSPLRARPGRHWCLSGRLEAGAWLHYAPAPGGSRPPARLLGASGISRMTATGISWPTPAVWISLRFFAWTKESGLWRIFLAF